MGGFGLFCALGFGRMIAGVLGSGFGVLGDFGCGIWIYVGLV